MRVCKFCLNEFQERRGNQRYCSVKCQRTKNETTIERRARKKERLAEKLTEDPDYRRRYHYKTKFGLSLEEYDEMWEAQGKTCAICSIEKKPHQRAFAVDHDHETGEIFGILCVMCNHKLIADIRDPEIYDKAAAYLRGGTGKYVPDKYKKPKRRRRKRNGKNTRSKNSIT